MRLVVLHDEGVLLLGRQAGQQTCVERRSDAIEVLRVAVHVGSFLGHHRIVRLAELL